MSLPGFTAEFGLGPRVGPARPRRAVSPWSDAAPGAAEVVPAARAAPGGAGGGARGRVGFSCDGAGCLCTGYDDCIDMFNTNVCGPNAICYTFGSRVICLCGR
jgi:hypothetical protein